MGQIISDYEFEKYLENNQLMGSRCNSCGSLFVPPRAICGHCHQPELEWVEMSGKGQLTAFTCIAIGPPSMAQEGYDRNNPYCSGVVALEEGPHVVARIEGVDPRHPESIKIGCPLSVKYLHRDGGQKTVLGFVPQ